MVNYLISRTYMVAFPPIDLSESLVIARFLSLLPLLIHFELLDQL